MPGPDEPDIASDLFAAPPLPVAPLDDAQRLACLRLIRSENVGPATFRALINHYGGATQALEALPQIGRRAGRGRPIRICTVAQAEAEIETASKAGAHLLFTIEPGYPAALALLDGAPPLLYVKGRIEFLNRPVIAIVGSRDASAAGHKLARQFAGAFGAAGFVVASGLARGIDAAAHQASLPTGTIAILAGGIDNVYPPEHKAMHQAIGETGCLVAEQPIGYQPRGQDFPRRNRIISGVARAVVIVEAARRSGTLITARLANEQGRDVFAVPGHPLDPRAEGTNQLIKDGATMVTVPADVLDALGADQAPRWSRPLEEQTAHQGVGTAAATGRRDARAMGGLTEMAAPERARPPATALAPAMLDEVVAAVLAVLGPAPVNLDEVAMAARLPIRTVQIATIELALAGQIEFHGSHLVSLKPP